ncbi:MAG: 30S ribosomal protein S9 [Parcubacteria group bacterium]|nr:30S ribosomal protein S9 [Parcubacteria group bacterium]
MAVTAKKTKKVVEAVEKIPYVEAVGRRKNANARVRLYTKGVGILVNEKAFGAYFHSPELSHIVDSPLKKLNVEDRFSVTVHVTGGGTRGQAEAIRHGIARALVKTNPEFRKRLKRAGYLKRDPRAKERRKYGLKKARKSPQWQKR